MSEENNEQRHGFHKEINFFAKSFTAINEFRKHGYLCDVILKVEDQSFPAHRNILSSVSPYFHAMFSSNMTESFAKEITMKEIEPRALEELLNYMYSGEVEINNQNAQNLFIGANFLQLKKVKTACANFFIAGFHPENVLEIRQLADTFDCTNLATAADKYIHQNFSRVARTEEFFALDCSRLIELIESDDLDVDSEETIFEASMKWIRFNEKERARFLPEILSKIRLPLLSPWFLVEQVSKDELIRSSQQCRESVDEAKNFYFLHGQKGFLEYSRTRHRSYFNSIGQIYVVGGQASPEGIVLSVEKYDPLTNVWKFGKKMCEERCSAAVAVHERKLYVFGGWNGERTLSSVEKFDRRLGKWSNCSEMLSKRRGAGAAIMGDCIYVCGGYDGTEPLKTVECYCPKSDSWKEVASMLECRWTSGFQQLDEYIYAVGGRSKDYSVLDSVERFNPIESDNWSRIKSMNSKRWGFGIAALNGKLYVCGGNDGNVCLQTVEVYDPSQDTWTSITSMNCKRQALTVVAKMGKIWAIGGHDGKSALASVEVYIPMSDKWSFVHSMFKPRYEHGSCFIP